MPIENNIIKPDDVPFKISDPGFYLDGSLTAIVDGSCYDFMGRKIFTTGLFRKNIGFGITNIDIEINQSLQPIITITLKDLYGNVVFGKGEIDKEVPDYSVLFNWPPPKFLFTFKGYLGKQVSWMLNLKKTGTTYQADGSYEIKCEFVPNQWGFMGDLPFLFLLAVKGLKRKELQPDQFKTLQTIFDLIKIGKKVEVKTKEASREFDTLLQQMTLIKAGRIVEAICYSQLIKLDEEIDGTAGNLKITGNGSLNFAKVTINAAKGFTFLDDSYDSIEKLKEYTTNNAEALRKMNTFLFLNATIGGAAPVALSTVDDVNFDNGGYKEEESRQRVEIISNNIKLIEDAIRQRSYESSKSQLRQITIGEIFKQLAQDSGYILGKILEAGQKGFEASPSRKAAAEDNKIIGMQYPLMIDTDKNEEIPAKGYKVNENELAFINEFISAVSEGVALDLVQDSQALGLANDTALVKRINNAEAPRGNPYAPFFRNIAQNIMIRSGIIAFLTRSDDPNYPGDYQNYGIDRESIEEVLTLAAADMENVSTSMLSQLDNKEYIQLRQFCNYWKNLMTTDGLYYVDDEGKTTTTEIPTNKFEKLLPADLFDRGVIVDRASNTRKTLNGIFDEVFGSIAETENTVGGVIDNSSALYINKGSMQSQAVYNNRILYRVPETSIGDDDYIFVLFKGADATKAKEANNSSSDGTVKGENLDENLLGIVSIDAFKGGDNSAELGRVSLINKRFSTAVLKYSEMANPPRLAWKDAANWDKYVVFDKTAQIVDPSVETVNSETKIDPAGLAVSMAFHPYSADQGLIFGPFYTTSSGRNHRASIRKMCEVILETMSTLEEERNKVISSVVGKAEEGKNALYKQFHVLYHQWEVMMYSDPANDDGNCSENNKISSKSIVNTLEERFGGSKSDDRHISIKKESRKAKIKTLDSNVFIYDCPVSDVANIDVKNSLINIEPLYKPDGNTTVLNMIQQLCTKNNFTFVAVPGNGDFNDYSEVFKPHPSTPQRIQNLFYVLFSPTPENRTTLSNSSQVILSQSKPPILNTEAFEVKVGSTENKIFKGLTIDSSENKPTAESVFNLQKLTDNQNQNKKIGIECSTLPVMEGKSYMAGFTMLGNAQIFPMQYFYLNSIPLFNGLYQIKTVKHNITPNSMTTTAEGMRMRVSKGKIASIRPITLETFENLGIQIDSIDASDLDGRDVKIRPVVTSETGVAVPLVEAGDAESIVGGTPSGEYIPYDKLSTFTQGILNVTNRLVVVREFSNGERTGGTMWYNKQVLGFTVEDAVLKVGVPKELKKTAIPKGNYFVALDTTGAPGLTRNYVTFSKDSRAKFKSPGVFPRVGSNKDGVNLDSYGLSFAGIRIHNGTDESWSDGCIIYSSERLSDGRLKNDLNHCKALTKLIYDESIDRITVTNEFERLGEQTPNTNTNTNTGTGNQESSVFNLIFGD
jgi:hypothetical protein